MRSIYSLLVKFAWLLLHLTALFQPKIKLFVQGRKGTFSKLSSELAANSKVLWMHVASLGEYEQGLPLLERLKEFYPDRKIVLTFFSPSGFEVKKGKTPADIVTYLPMDTASNAREFMRIVRPELAIFIKYEIWPNYLHYLTANGIPTLLVSGVFQRKQAYFKWYGGFLKKSLNCFTYFFVQDNNSMQLLRETGFDNVAVSGDTRFDRVLQILERDNHLPFMGRFKNNSACLVIGSSWPEDEALLIPLINTLPKSLKVVIAPHNIKEQHIQNVLTAITQKVALYSDRDNQNLEEAQVLIVDTVGLLTKIYSYADIAYVGGGFATGLHNTLEPAVFGIPILIGPKYSNFIEATELVRLGGILPVSSAEELEVTIQNMLNDGEKAKAIGAVNRTYIGEKVGATTSIMQYITTLI